MDKSEDGEGQDWHSLTDRSTIADPAASTSFKVPHVEEPEVAYKTRSPSQCG